jgi:hypothetical protein
MTKILNVLLIGSVFLFSAYKYNGSTLPAVVIAGGIIKAQHTDASKKYKRKDCPICKGTGFYISGDGIKKVDCGYCEPDKTQQKIITHSPVIIQQKNCPNGNCPIPQKSINNAR